MSFGEIIIVFIVCLLVTKPEDLTEIFKIIKSISVRFYKLKQEFMSYIELESNGSERNFTDNIEEINFFLSKIMEHKGEYTGKYELQEVKAKYKELVQIEIEKQKNNI